MATACLLLLMSMLLVGVTLRMAPIIDDMGERAFLFKWMGFKDGGPGAIPPSPLPSGISINEISALFIVIREQMAVVSSFKPRGFF